MKAKRISIIRNYTGAVLFMLFLNACAMLGWPTVRQKQILSVRAGMTEQNVLALCGEPQDRSIHKGQEEWYYYVYSGIEAMSYYIVFEQGKVVSLSHKSLEQSRREALGIDQRPPVVVQPIPYPTESPRYPGHQTQPPIYGGSVYTPQFEQSFEEFFRSVQRETFDSNKYQRMREAVRYRPFTCYHLVRLMKLFNFDSERIKVVEILAPAVIDKQNAHAIGEAFDFGNYRSRAIKILIDQAPEPSRTHTLGGYGYSMRDLDASFEEFYRALRREAFDSNKWERLREAVNYRYFTCRHCVRLIQLFTFDSDKTKVVEIVAPAIIDPENAYQVADEYTFSSDKERIVRLITRGK